MSRWRPPVPRSSPYITAEGARALEAELKELWQRRAVVVQHLSAAAAEGDRSENAEYIYRKKELRELDRRLRYLQKRLPDLKVVSNSPDHLDRVFFGAWVTLEDEDGLEITIRIVGADELNAKQNWISVDSPLARAILGKAVDDEVQVQAPSGVLSRYIVGIQYAVPDSPEV